MCCTVRQLLRTASWLEATAVAADAAALPPRALRSSYAFRISLAALYTAWNLLLHAWQLARNYQASARTNISHMTCDM